MKSIKISIFVLFFVAFSSAFAQNVNKKLNAADFKKGIESGSVQIIDVRTAPEFASGHIKGATNINLYDKEFKTKIGKLDKSKPVYLYCRSGARSNHASNIVGGLGFKEIYDLTGGVISWNASKFELVK